MQGDTMSSKNVIIKVAECEKKWAYYINSVADYIKSNSA